MPDRKVDLRPWQMPMILGSIVVAAASRNPEAILIAPAAMQQMSITLLEVMKKLTE